MKLSSKQNFRHTFLDAYYVVQAMFLQMSQTTHDLRKSKKICEKLCFSKKSILKRSPIANSATEDLKNCLDVLHKKKYQPNIRNGNLFFAYLGKVWTKQLKSSIDCSTVSGKSVNLKFKHTFAFTFVNFRGVSNVYLCTYLKLHIHTLTREKWQQRWVYLIVKWK